MASTELRSVESNRSLPAALVRLVQRFETDNLVGLVRMTVCRKSRLYYGWAVAPLCYDIKLELRRLSNL
jgi:hypothetical protein